MTTGTMIYIITMGFTVCIHGGITYLFTRKSDFSLLNGFSNRSEEEKEYLQESGYLKAMAKVFTYSFWLLLITFITGLFPIPFAFEIGITIFIVYLMVGLVWVQRFEVPHKRKKMLWVMGIITAATLIFLVVIVGLGYSDNDMSVTKDTFTIGMYGDEWSRSEIKGVNMLEELPEVIVKTNGYATSGILKGHFNLEEPYGGSLLFIEDRSGPFLYIETNDEHIFISNENSQETEAFFKQLED